MNRPSFTFTAEMVTFCRLFPPEKEIAMIQAVIEYGLFHKSPVLPDDMKIIWKDRLLPILDRQWTWYKNGRKGGAPKGNENALKKGEKTTQKQPKNNPNSTQIQPKNNPIFSSQDADSVGVISVEKKTTSNTLFFEENPKKENSLPPTTPITKESKVIYKENKRNYYKEKKESETDFSSLIEANPDLSEKYKNFSTWVADTCPSFLRLKEPMNILQYAKLRYHLSKENKIIGERYSAAELRTSMCALHNWAEFTKKRVSAYLSTLTQLKRDYGERDTPSA